jgi:hypothetical protein
LSRSQTPEKTEGDTLARLNREVRCDLVEKWQPDIPRGTAPETDGMGLSGKGSPDMTRKELKEIQMSDVSRPDELVTRIQGVGRWTLEVVESRMITPRMHRIRLRGPEFRGFDYRPRQDVMLWIPADGDAIILSSSILSLVIPKHAFEVLHDYYRPI